MYGSLFVIDKIILTSQKFYSQDTAKVASQLLGKILVRKFNGNVLLGKIVETEAYYGLKDPSSRAFTTPRMAQAMWNEGGTTFVYMVHNHWLLNVVTGSKGIPSAVLIRALEPLNNLELLKDHRKIEIKSEKEIVNLTNGPGKLTKAFQITKAQHGIDITKNNELFIAQGKKENFSVGSSHRIGVSKDLKRKLRFFIKGNRFVSRKFMYDEC